MFYTIKETRKYKIYTLKKWAMIAHLIWTVLLLIFVFLFVRFSLNAFFLAIFVFLSICFLFAGNFLLMIDQIRNQFNGKKIITSGGTLAFLRMSDFIVKIEK